ncbi:hypothetical protein CF15_03710 [Pyrodictium occultum]|uniref:Uncharacterized protein n=1 Tax=Pyrodictium occultum TaxID=2309 RepID=A0A0V8RV28_PYROC|nr:hypothetical protein [Pyrodictium occultum]KSW11913.1 hypothetical protein CF15_03710 [Pyrodictium occultum]
MGEEEQAVYIVVCSEGLYQAAGLAEALLTAASRCSGEAVVYRVTRVLQLAESELNELRSVLRTAAREGGEPRGKHIGEVPKPSGRAPEYAVVFDQMYKGFADILAREIEDPRVEFHEVLGRGINRPLKAGERVYRQPAKDDYDILKLLEQLANRYRGGVLFFTGDKRLANQARLVPGVHVEYIPPGEVAGKEMALKLMAQRIRSWILGGRPPEG